MRILIHTNGNPIKSAGGYSGVIRTLGRIFSGNPNNEVFFFLTCFNKSSNKILSLTEIINTERTNLSTLNNTDKKMLNNVSYVLHKDVFMDIEVINNAVKKYKIDLFFTLCDILIFSDKKGKGIEIPCACWWPCHYDPIDNRSIQSLKIFDRIFSLCPTVTAMLMKILPDKHITFCPHIIEYEEDKSLKKEEIRKKFKIPLKSFVWLVNAKHYEQSNRKSYDDFMMAYLKFLKKHPNSYLYMNNANTRRVRCPLDFTIPDKYPVGTIIKVKYSDKDIDVPYNPQYKPGKTYSAQIELTCKESPNGIYDIKVLAKLLKIPEDKYHINDEELTEQKLKELYHCADVLIAATKSEGFGLPVLEAQAVGLPVVTTDYLAMGDFTFNGISHKPLQKLYQPLQTAFWVQPSQEGIAKAAEDIKNWSYRKRTANKIRGQYIIKGMMSYNSVKNVLISNLKTLNFKKKNVKKKKKKKK